MYSQVINYIKQRVEISREEIEESLKHCEFKQYAKGDYILRAGEYCRFIGFLNKKGLLLPLLQMIMAMKRLPNLNMKIVFLLTRKGL